MEIKVNFRDALVDYLLLCGMVAALTSMTDAAKLPEPEIVSTAVISPTEIQVKWHDPGLGERQRLRDKRHYTIKYFVHQHRSARLEVTRVKDTHYVMNNLHPNTTYVFRVRVIKGQRSSAWSKTAVNRTFPLETFIEVAATALTSTSVVLAWTPPRQQISESDTYTVYWSEEDQDVKVTQVKAVTRSHVFRELLPGQQYSFRLLSEPNSRGEVSTGTASIITYTDRPSKPPRDIKMDIIGSKLIRVSWSPPPVRKRHGEVTQYKIQYKRQGRRRGDVCTVVTSGFPRLYNLTDIDDGATYRVRVAARTVNGTGPYSKWSSVDVPVKEKGGLLKRMIFKKIHGKRKGSKRLPDFLPTTHIPATTTPEVLFPNIPSDLRVFNVTSTSVRLRWTAPPVLQCCPVVAYRILVEDETANQLERDIVTGSHTEAVVEWLDPGTSYAINISSFNTQGSSQQSRNIHVTTSRAVSPVMEVTGATVLVGGRANLSCSVTGDPIPSIDWYREGSMAPYYKQQSLNMLVHTQPAAQLMRHMHLSARRIEAHLVIESVIPRDGGFYTCSAFNSRIGTVNKTVELKVHALPSFKQVEKRHGIAGSHAQMACVATGIPLPDVKWFRFKDGLVFNETRDSRIYVSSDVNEIERTVNKTLHFTKLRLSDEGNYTCQAKRGLHSTWRVVPLTLEVPLPPPVKNIRALAVSPSKVSVFWERPENYEFPITAYKVQCRQPSLVFNTTDLFADITDLDPETVYHVEVTAYNVHGIGDVSPVVKVRTLPNTGLEPANVSAVALNISTIQLDWEAPGVIAPRYIQGFNIYYRKGNSTRQDTLFIAGSANKQFMIGLGRENEFYLRIATVLTWGEEASSQWIQIRKNVAERKPPPPPRRLAAVASSNSIQLSWRQPLIPPGRQRPEVHIRGYSIRYVATDSRGRARAQEVSGHVMTVTLTGLSAGRQYKIAVMAFNDHGISRPINIIARTKDLRPGAVVSAVANPMSSTEILIQWLEPEQGPVTRFHVRYWRPGKRDKQSAWLYMPNMQYIAGSLRKNSEYRFEIIPYNNEQIGEIIVLYATTMVDSPDEPPRAVTVVAINSTALQVKWDPPPKPFQNGAIKGYKLVLKQKTGKRLASFSVDGSRRNYTFKHLEASMAYRVRVAAMTVKGTGPSCKWVTQTTKKVQLRAPESPGAMDTNVSSSSIYVTWTASRDIGVPVLGYIVGYGRYIPEVYRQVFGPDVFSYTMENLEPDTGYIVSVRAYNNYGESLPKFVVGKTEQADPRDLPLHITMRMRATSLSISEIQITWLIMNADMRTKLTADITYLVRFSSVHETEFQFINATSLPVTIGNLRKATKYEFSVKGLRGSQETEWSLPVHNTTFQTVPAYPGNLTLTPDPLKHTTLTLTWNASEDDVEEYIIYSTTTPELKTKHWEMTNLPGSLLRMRVHELMPHTPYYFHIQARNMAGYGPLSDRVTYTPPSEPAAAPRDLIVTPLHGKKSTTVEVTWSTPEKPTGLITDYTVYYTPENNVTASEWMVKKEPSVSCLLIGLDYNATYRIMVRARYSGGGLGPASPVVSYTTLSYMEIENRLREQDHIKNGKISKTTYKTTVSNYTTTKHPKHTSHQTLSDGTGHQTLVDGTGHQKLADDDIGHHTRASDIGHRTISDDNIGHHTLSDDIDHQTPTDDTGHQTIAASTGHQTLAANTGHQTLASDTGHQTLAANTGHQTLAADTGHQTLATNTGHQTLAANTGHQTLAANTGHQTLAANTGHQTLAASTGHQTLAANTGHQTLAADTGHQTLADDRPIDQRTSTRFTDDNTIEDTVEPEHPTLNTTERSLKTSPPPPGPRLLSQEHPTTSTQQELTSSTQHPGTNMSSTQHPGPGKQTTTRSQSSKLSRQQFRLRSRNINTLDTVLNIKPFGVP